MELQLRVDRRTPAGGVYVLLLASVALALLLTACGREAALDVPEADSDTASESIQGEFEELADGTLDVIVFPMVDEPFVAPNLDAGVLAKRGGVDRFRGIDVDIMAAYAKHLNVDVVFSRLDSPGFGDLIPALMAGKGDMIASALTIKDEREAIIDFSQPYFTVSIVIVTRTDADIEGPEDLEGRVGVSVAGGLPYKTVRDAGFTGEIREAEFGTGVYADLSDGQADFAIMESASARAGLRSRPGLKVAFSFPGRDHYGFATRDDSRMISSINAFLDTLRANGELDRIIERHLGPDPLSR